MRKRLLFFSAAVLTTVLCAAIYTKAKSSFVELDLSKLSTVAPSQKYQDLIATVEAVHVPKTGFAFAVLGDTRSNLETAEKIMARALEEKPAFILHTGDIISAGLPEQFLDHHMKLVALANPTPIIPVPGNHEKGPDGTYATFKEVYGSVRFSFDYDGCRFVGIPDDERTGMLPEDLNYLRENLAEPGPKYRFVFTHVPPKYVTELAAPKDGRGFTKGQDEFRKIVEQAQVAHVFLGHIHGFGTATIAGVAYTITGGGGANLTKRLPDEAKVYNFILVHVSTAGVQAEAFLLREGQWSQQPL